LQTEDNPVRAVDAFSCSTYLQARAPSNAEVTGGPTVLQVAPRAAPGRETDNTGTSFTSRGPPFRNGPTQQAPSAHCRLTTELDTSHVPMLSKSKDVSAVIMEAAAKAGQ